MSFTFQGKLDFYFISANITTILSLIPFLYIVVGSSNMIIFEYKYIYYIYGIFIFPSSPFTTILLCVDTVRWCAILYINVNYLLKDFYKMCFS